MEQKLEELIRYHLRTTLAKDLSDVSNEDVFHAISLSIKGIAVEQLLQTERRYRDQDLKRVYYLSMEFLIGRTLENNLLNLKLLEECRKAVKNLGWDLDTVISEESDPALGNGGLGRLAACFLDSLATLGLPGFGYGINYQFGLFKQTIEDGYQKEKPDRWMADSSYWQISRPDKAHSISLYGYVQEGVDCLGNPNPKWVGAKTILGVPHDMPIIGYEGQTVNFLRLYSAQTSNDFDISIFNQGDYFKAVEEKITSEKISKVLYPSDEDWQGKELRFIQEYFFVSCALHDIFRRYLRHHKTFDDFTSKVAIQMNDTHPAIAVAELMRLFVDEHHLEWNIAWKMTCETLAYTNHTLLSEALEKWPVSLFERVLPRHLQIIYEINRRLLQEVATKWPEDSQRLHRMSLVQEGPLKQIRMAHLAVTGSHSVNGVAALHSELVKKELFPDFYELWPEKFNNKTNGVTPRRWVAKSNAPLTEIISRKINTDWIKNLSHLNELEKFSTDKSFQQEFRNAKQINKLKLAAAIRENMGFYINPDSLFDTQAKRIHIYKRQLLNALRIIHDYLRVVEDRKHPPAPQTFIFSGKAAPSYWAAKQVIKLIHSIGQIVNQDRRSRDWLTVLFIPDYKVSVAELLIPATDLSEQISTAGTEASGTSNMKFALNGALTIGTKDGATIEMAQRVGAENMFLFGLEASEVTHIKNNHSYFPLSLIAENPSLRRVMEALRSNRFNVDEPGIFESLIQMLLSLNDPYLHLADFETYTKAHDEAVALYKTPSLWTEKSILTTSRMSFFSSDRTIEEYSKDIWHLKKAA
ncbi:MAG: glycogen/starch/alpha-glucan phosphorylase [Elusimicrobiota bacterium]